MREMTVWEQLEAWIIDHDTEEFTNRDIADSLDLPTGVVSAMIRSYLAAQRRPNANTLYVLKREGRTSNAVWSVGQRTVDARTIGSTLFEDVGVKVRRAFAPDLKRLAERNPRAARYVEAKIEAVITGALAVLAAAVDAYDE